MILDTTRNSSPCLAKTRLGFIITAAALMVMGAISFAPRIMLAQITPPPVPASPDVAPPPVAPPTAVPIGASSEDVILPEPESPLFAQTDEPLNPGPNDVHPGPKLKTRPFREVDALTPVQPPTTPHLPSIAHPVPPPPPAIHAPHGPMIAAGPPAPARAARAPRPPGADASMEERLARVERMLESLLGDKKMNEGELHLHWPEGKWDLKGPAKLKEGTHLINPQEIEKIKEHAKREAARATEEVKRAAREMQKARVEQNRQARGQVKEASEKQIEALRRQMEHLDRQKEELGRQIERLQRDRQKLQQKEDEEGEEDFGDFDLDLELELELEQHNHEIKEECITKEPAGR
jgi:hypothetical protein